MAEMTTYVIDTPDGEVFYIDSDSYAMAMFLAVSSDCLVGKRLSPKESMHLQAMLDVEDLMLRVTRTV
jgi:hypothetical protein